MDLALSGVGDPALDARAEVARLWTVSRWRRVMPRSVIDRVLSHATVRIDPRASWTPLVATLIRCCRSPASPTLRTNAAGSEADISSAPAPVDVAALVSG